jgi:prepilin-type N-terminal cleavage/methylation domain-containing protein
MIKNQTKNPKGFSLIELLIVVAIILIIAAIAVPNLIRSRMSAAQASAVASVHTINTAAISYDATYGNGFPPTLQTIGNNGTTTITCTNAELIDSLLTTGLKQGYTFKIVPGAVQVNSSASSCASGYGYADGYMVTAVPVSVGTTGQASYCSDASSVIRSNPSGVVNPGPSPNCASTDAPLQ